MERELQQSAPWIEELLSKTGIEPLEIQPESQPGLYEIENNSFNPRERLPRSGSLVMIITGPSAAGKDAIFDELLKESGKYVRVKTCTTRPPRPGEEENDPYFRLTKEDFLEAEAAGQMIESKTYAEYEYGLRKKDFKETIETAEEEDRIPILRINPEGVETYLEMFENQDPLLKIQLC